MQIHTTRRASLRAKVARGEMNFAVRISHFQKTVRNNERVPQAHADEPNLPQTTEPNAACEEAPASAPAGSRALLKLQ